jgi:hypothetical protein
MAGLTPARSIEMSSNHEKQSAVDFVERVRVNQQKLKSHYDFIVDDLTLMVIGVKDEVGL